MRCQHGIPRMLLIWLLINPFYLPIQPVKGLGQRHQKGIEPLGHFAYFILFKGVGKQMKLRMLAFQQFVHRVAEGRFKQRLLLLFLTHSCQWIHAHRLEIVPNDLLTEGVDRGNVRAFQFIQGLAHAFGIALCFLDHALIESLAHFRRSRPGEGDNQHAVKVIPLTNQPNDAFHQHGCFSRACCGADENGVVSRLNSRLLLFCPLGHVITSSALFHVKHFVSFAPYVFSVRGRFSCFLSFLILLYIFDFTLSLIFLLFIILT